MSLLEKRKICKEPEWNALNINRKEGSTTFKQCGWCVYVGCGSCRYSCHIDGSCGLLKDYGPGSEVYWDTPCIVRMLSKKDILAVCESKVSEIEGLYSNIREEKKFIKVLRGLKPTIKPALAVNGADFDDGSIVWVWTNKKWCRGIVVPGYRSHDGCVSYVLDDFPETKNKPWGCGVSVPCILKEWDYKYFKAHKDEFLVWLELQDREYNGEKLNMKEMYLGLI